MAWLSRIQHESLQDDEGGAIDLLVSIIKYYKMICAINACRISLSAIVKRRT